MLPEKLETEPNDGQGIAVSEGQSSDTDWTIYSLYHHFSQIMTAQEARFHERLTAQEVRFSERLSGQERNVEQALAASEKAITKAEAATDTRFQSVNEFRATLSDQSSLFMQRSEALALFERNTQRMDEIQATVSSQNNTFMQKVEARALIDQVRALIDQHTIRIAELQSRLDRMQGSSTGHQAFWGYLVAVIAAVGTLIAIALAFLK